MGHFQISSFFLILILKDKPLAYLFGIILYKRYDHQGGEFTQQKWCYAFLT